jgi:hypothetical protein
MFDARIATGVRVPWVLVVRIPVPVDKAETTDGAWLPVVTDGIGAAAAAFLLTVVATLFRVVVDVHSSGNEERMIGVWCRTNPHSSLRVLLG